MIDMWYIGVAAFVGLLGYGLYRLNQEDESLFWLAVILMIVL